MRFRIHAAPYDGELDDHTIVIVPSRAFGDGRHETTRMCLQALEVFAPRGPFRMLDVGSGSGILSVAAAKLGGEAVGVEIDQAANEVAVENARCNHVADRVAFATTWPPGSFDVIVANILRDVLLDLVSEIVVRLAKCGLLVLSGLVSTDVPEIIARYAPLLDGRRPEIFERGPWRTLVWRKSSNGSGATYLSRSSSVIGERKTRAFVAILVLTQRALVGLEPASSRVMLLARMNYVLFVTIAVGTGACAAGDADDTTSEASSDALNARADAFYFVGKPPGGRGPDCLEALNKTESPICLGAMAPPPLNVTEKEAFRDAISQGRAIAKAKLVTFNGGAAAGAQMIASDAWVSSATGAPSGTAYLVHRKNGALEAKRVNANVSSTVQNLEYPSSITSSERQESERDLDGAGAIVLGDIQNGTLVATRSFVHVKHVRTMYDSWNFDEAPGDHLAGATFEVVAGAQLSLSLTSYPNGQKVEADRITDFSSTPPLEIKADRKTPPPGGDRYAFYDFRVPEGASAGDTFLVTSKPDSVGAGNPKWDFSFTIKVANRCRATFSSGSEDRHCD